MILWLLTWAESRHSKADRRSAEVMLVAIFSSTLDGKSFYASKVASLVEAHMGECIMQNSQDFPCGCVRYALRSLTDDARSWQWGQLVDSLMELSSTASCPACKLVYEELLSAIAMGMNNAIKNREAGDITKEATEMKNGRGKRRRVDEDLKDHIMKQNISSTGRSPTVMLRYNYDRCADIFQYWMKEGLCSHRLACKSALTCLGAVCFADDSSSHGLP